MDTLLAGWLAHAYRISDHHWLQVLALHPSRLWSLESCPFGTGRQTLAVPVVPLGRTPCCDPVDMPKPCSLDESGCGEELFGGPDSVSQGPALPAPLASTSLPAVVWNSPFWGASTSSKGSQPFCSCTVSAHSLELICIAVASR